MLTANVAARIISLVTTLLTAAFSTVRCFFSLHRTGSTYVHASLYLGTVMAL